MPNQTPIPTQINIAPSGMTWKNWKLVHGTDGFTTRETMEKYLCNPDRVRDLEECRDLNHRTIKQLDALIQLYEAQMEAVGAGGVEPLRKCNKLHQIAEPATVQAAPSEVMGALRALHDSVELAIQRGALSERALEIIIMQPATDVLMRAAAPQAVQDAVPLFWVRLLRDGLYEGPVHNNSVGGKMLRDEKPGEWHPLYLHTAPAHPAEGVPAQVHSALTDARAVLLSINRGDSHRVKVGDDVCYWQRDEWVQWAINEVLPMVDAALAATHPTQQGMADLRWQIVHDHIGGEYIAGRACFVVQIPALPGANIMRGSVAEHFTKAVDAIAAQAKQGEQANG